MEIERIIPHDMQQLVSFNNMNAVPYDVSSPHGDFLEVKPIITEVCDSNIFITPENNISDNIQQLLGKVSSWYQPFEQNQHPLTSHDETVLQEYFHSFLPHIKSLSQSHRKRIYDEFFSFYEIHPTLIHYSKPIFQRILQTAYEVQIDPIMEVLQKISLTDSLEIVSHTLRKNKSSFQTELILSSINMIYEHVKRRDNQSETWILTIEEEQSLQDYFQLIEKRYVDLQKDSSETKLHYGLRNLYWNYPQMQPIISEKFLPIVKTPPHPTIINEHQTTRYRIEFIKMLCNHINQSERKKISDSLWDLGSGIEGQFRSKILYTLLSEQHTKDIRIKDLLETEEYSLHDIPDLFNHPGFHKFLEIMSKNYNDYRYQLAVLFSSGIVRSTPDSFLDNVPLYSTSQQWNLNVQHNQWYLCDLAESNLEDSLHMQAASVITDGKQDLFLVKLKGRLSALCLKNMITPDGTIFIAGNWYALTDEESRQYVKKQIEKGNNSIRLEIGSWALIRNLGDQYHHYNYLLDQAIDFAHNRPKRIPEIIDGIKRHKYIEKHKESYTGE